MSEKILFTDLDGTLLTSDKKISPALRGLLSDFTRQDGHLVFSTGRMLESALKVLSANGVLFPNTLIIAANGNTIYDPSCRRLLLHKTVPLSSAAGIIRAARALSLYIQTYEDGYVLSEKDGPELSFYRKGTGMEYLLVDDLICALQKPPGKLLAIDLKDRTRLLRLRDEILSRFGDTLTAMFSCQEYLEIFDKTAGKGNAVRFVCQYLNLSPSSAVAAGDAENDLSMLQAAGIGVAMANAASPVKEAAGFITTHDNDHDGLADVLFKYFLPIE